MARPRSTPEENSNHIPPQWGSDTPEMSIEKERQGIDTMRASVRDRAKQGDLYFPQELVPEGWQYAWIVERILNQPYRDKIQKAYTNGWRFVHESEHPEWFMPDFDEGMGDGRIRSGGQILMKKPYDDWLADQLAFEAEDRLIKEQSSHLTDYLGNNTNRFKVENESGYSPIRTRAR